jgi:hypothetical protein
VVQRCGCPVIGQRPQRQPTNTLLAVCVSLDRVPAAGMTGTQFSKGMMVLAMFPNTTAFYPATVQVGPRRVPRLFLPPSAPPFSSRCTTHTTQHAHTTHDTHDTHDTAEGQELRAAV